jgi:hypothetical protein
MMQTRWIHSAAFALTLALTAVVARAQTSFAASAYGAFSGTTTGNGQQQSTANSAGALFELRHISNLILGFEATYSYNRADQTYVLQNNGSPTCGISCGLPATIAPLSIPNNANEITADWTPSLHVANLRPFGVLGAGVLFNRPATSAGGTRTSIQAVYVYGVGLDWGLLPHLGVRFQYRGNLSKAPDLSALNTLYSSTDAFTHTAEPMIGAYFNF